VSKDKKKKSNSLTVPRNAAAASKRGAGGQSWMTGDASKLGADFRDMIDLSMAGATMGQAHKDLAGQGFRCGFGGDEIACVKTMQVQACTLTWSVSLEGEGAKVEGVSGGGFTRQCRN
jgi:hypothetical protein